MSKGFTLIELLVSISIIGIVFGVIVSSMSVIQRNARDAQRKSDFSRLQSALQQYYADQNNYPQPNISSGSSGGSSIGTSTRTYLSSLPVDPNTSSGYTYRPLSGTCTDGVTSCSCDNSATPCLKYCLYSKLENTPSPAVNFAQCPAISGTNYQASQP